MAEIKFNYRNALPLNPNPKELYFIKNNRVEDSGTHNELFNRVPDYKKFVEEQIIETSKI